MNGNDDPEERYTLGELIAAAGDLAHLRFEILRAMMNAPQEIDADMLRTERRTVEQAIQQRLGGRGPVAVLHRLIGEVWDRESALLSALLETRTEEE